VSLEEKKMASVELQPEILKNNWIKVKEKKPELIEMWRPIININRYLGIALLQPVDEEPYFKYRQFSCWLIISGVIVFIFSYSLTLTSLGFQHRFTRTISSLVLVELVIELIYLIHCQLTIVFFLHRGKRFVDLFQHWIETERSLKNKHIYQPIGNAFKYYYCIIIILLQTESVIRLLSDLFQVTTGFILQT